MSVTVELGLSKAFTLDDPGAGVIGSTEFVIGGVSFEDVTEPVDAGLGFKGFGPFTDDGIGKPSAGAFSGNAVPCPFAI